MFIIPMTLVQLYAWRINKCAFLKYKMLFMNVKEKPLTL